MSRSVPRRRVQLLAVVLLAGCAAMLLLPGGAHAAGAVSTKRAVLQQAWFWQNAYEQANPPVAEQAPATEPSGVPAGDLAVAYTGNSDKSSSKMTALSFDLSGLPAGTTVQQFTITLTLDTQASATSFNTVGATVVACQPTRLWPAVLGGDYSNEPTVDCSKKVAPVVAGNTYTFKIPAIAQSWVDDQNLGVALVTDPDKTVAPFQVVFGGAKSIHAAMTYLPPLTSGSAATSPAAGAGTQPAVAAAGGRAAPPAAPSTGGVALPGPVADTTGSAAPPVVAGAPSSAAVPVTKPLAAVRPASAAPPAGFWAGGIVLGLVLLACSLVLGDPEPAPAAQSRTRIDRVLRERDTATLTAGRA